MLVNHRYNYAVDTLRSVEMNISASDIGRIYMNHIENHALIIITYEFA